MMKASITQWLLFTLLTAGVLLLTADAAFAGDAGPFACAGGEAVGSLYNSSITCPKTLESGRIFSFLVCNMEQLASNLMGNMFCGMMLSLTPAVQGALVIATVIFGIGFTIGVIPATAREFQIFLLKVACVWVFATQSEYILDIGYKLLINGVRDGVAIALTGYGELGSRNTPLVYSQLDGFLAQMIKFATDYVGADAAAVKDGCKNALFAVMAVMAIAFPPIFFLGIALIMRVAITFLRAIFGYIYAIVGIAFLLTLAPFFLSFYLFKQTRPFFDKWVGYMVSFALQIVILFAFLAFILSVNNAEPYTDTNLNGMYDVGEPYIDSSPPNGKRDTGIGTEITQLVMPVQQTKEGGSFRMPWDYCTVCEFEVFDPVTGTTIPQAQYSKFLRTGQMRCLDYRKPEYPDPKPADMDPDTGRVPIKLDASASPNKDKLNALIQFAGAGLMALLVLAYILESLLAYVGSLAQTLAGGFGGATYAPQLGGGLSPGGRPVVGMPGDGLYHDFESGMDRGFASQKDSIRGTAEGIRSGFAQMVEGRKFRYDKDGNAQTNEKGERTRYRITDSRGQPVDAGLKDRFIDWLVDPNHIDRDR